MLTRREFSFKAFSLTVLAFVFPMIGCGETEALKSLRDILRAVEKAVTALTAIPGLLPEVVHQVAKYLTSVTNFVEKVGEILENDLLSNAEKSTQILNLAAGVVLPNIQDNRVSAILLGVVAAFNAFMALFKSRQNQSFSMSDTEKIACAQIETEARADTLMVEEWVKDTLGGK